MDAHGAADYSVDPAARCGGVICNLSRRQVLNVSIDMWRRSNRWQMTALATGLGVVLVAAWRISLAADAARAGANPDMPHWPVNERFKKEIFTFARLKYSVDATKHGLGHNANLRWSIDWPDADWNFSYRLHQVTAIQVDPETKAVDITDPELFDYPMVYVVEPGRLAFKDEEVPIMQRYLLGGGFLWCDDFWGDREWKNFEGELKRVLPGREPVELPLEHPIFQGIFPLKEKPQVLNADLAEGAQRLGIDPMMRRPDEREPHYRAILDDRGRIMVLLCHNTDTGDGWEREGDNEFYFREYSEKKAFPLGINILLYAMTH